MDAREKGINRGVWVTILGGFLYGYNVAVIAGALLFITTAYSLSVVQQGIAVSIFVVGAMVTSSCAGLLANALGRKKAMMISAAFFLIGSLICAFAPSFHILLLARFIVGLGAGITTTIAPIYLTEIAPPEKRGTIVNTNQISLSLGFLIAYLLNYIFSFSQNWRGMFGVAAIPAAVQFVGLFFIEETLKSKIELQNSSFKLLFHPLYRSRVLLGLALFALQQVTGVGVALNFAPRVFEDSGYGASTSLFITATMGLLNLIAIFISCWLIDRAGRRLLLLWSFGGMFATLLLLCTSFLFPSLAPLSIVGLLFFMVFYSIGSGPVPPLWLSEVCPIQIRGHALNLAAMIGWGSYYLIALTFLDLSVLMTPAGIFALYACFCLPALWLSLKKIPETKGKTQKEIEQLFHS